MPSISKNQFYANIKKSQLKRKRSTDSTRKRAAPKDPDAAFAAQNLTTPPSTTKKKRAKMLLPVAPVVQNHDNDETPLISDNKQIDL